VAVVLIYRALGLGDFLTGVPAYRALRRAYPDHRIVLAAPRALAPLAELTGAIDEVVDTVPLGPAPRDADVAVNLHGRGPQSTALLRESGARQVIAYGRPGDALLAFSTSGGSENVLAALAQARRDGLVTIAFVGYGGGRILDDELADHVVVTRSEHIPRIQEAQASAWHVLRRLMEGP